MTAGATYVPIATQTLASTASSITFSSIPQTYTDLVLVCFAQNNRSGIAYDGIVGIYSGDTNSGHYSSTLLNGNGSTAGSSRIISASGFYGYLGDITTTSGSTGFGNSVSHIMNYANTTTYKTSISRGNSITNVANAMVSLWQNTGAITSITLQSITGTTPVFSVGSSFTLYGIASA